MQKIAGFRNILVHDYLEVDNKIVSECLQKVEVFQRFATHVLTWL
ncbi:MAG: HepT-like ribonuclease domain-containing protein [Bacillota bacterium]